MPLGFRSFARSLQISVATSDSCGGPSHRDGPPDGPAVGQRGRLRCGRDGQLQGCVVEAERKGSYVFSRVTVCADGVVPRRHLTARDYLAADAGVGI